MDVNPNLIKRRRRDLDGLALAAAARPRDTGSSIARSSSTRLFTDRRTRREKKKRR